MSNQKRSCTSINLVLSPSFFELRNSMRKVHFFPELNVWKDTHANYDNQVANDNYVKFHSKF